jgi:hypothetical protein
MNGKQMAGLFVAVTIAAVFLTPFSTIIAGSTGVQSVQNTTVTADVGNASQLDGYDVVADSETVYRYNQSAGTNETLTAGTDYEINDAAARLRPLASGAVQDGDTLYVSYDYRATSSTVSRIAGFAPLMLALLILVTIGNKIQA